MCSKMLCIYIPNKAESAYRVSKIASMVCRITRKCRMIALSPIMNVNFLFNSKPIVFLKNDLHMHVRLNKFFEGPCHNLRWSQGEPHDESCRGIQESKDCLQGYHQTHQENSGNHIKYTNRRLWGASEASETYSWGQGVVASNPYGFLVSVPFEVEATTFARWSCCGWKLEGAFSWILVQLQIGVWRPSNFFHKLGPRHLRALPLSRRWRPWTIEASIYGSELAGCY